MNTDLDEATLDQYDGLNRLVRVETGTTTATYTYRPDGLRNSKTVNGVTTTQVWDGDNMVMELTGDTVTGKYLRGVGVIAAVLGGTRSYYQNNAHGDVSGLTDTAGTLSLVLGMCNKCKS